MKKKVWVLVSALAAVVVGCGGETSGGTDSGSTSPGAGGSGGGSAGGGGSGGGSAGKGGSAGSGAGSGGSAGSSAGSSAGGQAGAGAYCAGKVCGDFCNPCGPNEKCAPHYCHPDGSCTVEVPSCGAAGSGGYDPCKGLTCGAACDPCPPNVDCDVPGPTYCNEQGKCDLGVPACAGVQCKVNEDCPQFDNGTQGYCVEGKCIYEPIDPCAGKPCGATCDTCKPGQACPEVEMYCDASGACTGSFPVCGAECKVPEQCPVPELPCKQCPDGSLSCPEPTCVGGKCGVAYPPCGAVECKVPEQCPVPDGCAVCPDGNLACPQPTCEGGKCGVIFPGCQQPQCKGPEDCPVPPCEICPDGSKICAAVACVSGQCAYSGQSCPVPSCGPVKVKGVGACKQILGYYWDGSSCQALGGCECAGDCKALSPSFEACEKAHAGCAPPQCKSDFECPVPAVPCQQCPDGSLACPKGLCVGGQCQLDMGSCSADCSPADAVGVGPCAVMLGYVWNGKQCVGIGGCSCEGADCGEVTSFEKCAALHKGCADPCAGKKCGEMCSTCQGGLCPPVVEYCTMDGKCAMEKPVCAFP